MPTTSGGGASRQHLKTVGNGGNLLLLEQKHASLAVPEQTISSHRALSHRVTFYPAYCHAISPTWFTWVKLTNYAIHHILTFHPSGYHHSLAGQYRAYHSSSEPRVCFYLNHPIQFIQIVGIVTIFEPYFEKFWLFTVDDGSGAAIDVVCRKPKASAREDQSQEEKREGQEVRELSDFVQENVDVGVVVQVKGVITVFQRQRERKMEFRMNARNVTATAAGTWRDGTKISDEIETKSGVRQITLSRLKIVRDTMQETSLVNARTKFHKDILSKPWQISPESQQQLHQRVLGEHDRNRDRVRRHKRHEEREAARERDDQKLILSEYAAEEKDRQEEAERVRRAVLETISTTNMKSRLIENNIEDQDNSHDVESTTFFVDTKVRQDAATDSLLINDPNHPTRLHPALPQARRKKPKRRKMDPDAETVSNQQLPNRNGHSMVEQDQSPNHNASKGGLHEESRKTEKREGMESFAIDDEEKSALLCLAFGMER